ncbi:hypothetical protein BU24DRAFT_424849 [Aaosphaeria arxii CBS 175.79]|uniref:Uncharacterized protein n=1 Tax=Aaosphaeria arxii CBS 175.79 TaxID=1450172 RepID=A0A6A5XLW5_9PLEO|nr:uncharacterized protein BU24DRAFT_424849 [Aaosphaeria arxii CBS 175.79]KAF2013817.1 hypothetical protein BU24DRAFT_424849 [Aaosphaeria arxii CBS 175.79]
MESHNRTRTCINHTHNHLKDNNKPAIPITNNDHHYKPPTPSHTHTHAIHTSLTPQPQRIKPAVPIPVESLQYKTRALISAIDTYPHYRHTNPPTPTPLSKKEQHMS